MIHADDLQGICDDTLVNAVDYSEQLDSTNDRALQLASDPQQRLPLLVITGRQTAGRGRGVNAWWSSAGALTFSLVTDFDRLGVQRKQLPQISLWTGLAVRDALAEFLPMESSLRLKWPNDILLDGRKICGILSESVGSQPGRVVVGIGINVNIRMQHGDVPRELQETAVSLHDRLGIELSLRHVLDAVLCQLARRWQECAEGVGSLAEAWDPHCLLRDQFVRWRAGRQERAGRCLGIDTDGALRLDCAGKIHRCVGGTIESYEQS